MTIIFGAGTVRMPESGLALTSIPNWGRVSDEGRRGESAGGFQRNLKNL
ncbi:MAG: hypothetical protein WCG06_01820 [Candidatus Omnitrophota bacterium]